MNKIEFPSYNQVLQAIEKLKKVEWPKFDNETSISDLIKKIDEIYFEELPILPNIVKFKKPREFQFSLYRVREFDNIFNKDYISEYSYPPIEKTKIGRCNFPNRPVFYCSDNPMVALMETVRESDFKGKVFCLTKWNLIPSKEKFIVENFLGSGLHPDNPFNLLIETEIHQIKEQFNQVWNEDIEKGFLFLQAFLHETFINDHNYGLSAALANRTIFAPHDMATDILLYPSVQSKYKGVNMAINPNFVDQQMQLQRLYLVKLNRKDLEIGEFNISFTHSYGVVNKNRIKWKKIESDNEEYKKFIVEDFSHNLPDNFKFEFHTSNQIHKT
jgi:hypothetical protein